MLKREVSVNSVLGGWLRRDIVTNTLTLMLIFAAESVTRRKRLRKWETETAYVPIIDPEHGVSHHASSESTYEPGCSSCPTRRFIFCSLSQQPGYNSQHLHGYQLSESGVGYVENVVRIGFRFEISNPVELTSLDALENRSADLVHGALRHSIRCWNGCPL